MTPVEYKIVQFTLPIDDDDVTAQLNALGAEGWRLIIGSLVNEARLWFMREGTGVVDPPVDPPPEEGEPPVVIDAPFASGPAGTIARVGEQVSVTMGNWEGEPSRYAYLWKRRLAGGQVIPLENETASTYDTTVTDEGEAVFCGIEASNDFGQGYSESNDVSVIAAEEVAAPSQGKRK
jgi:hypothetical protein